jgi:hypothetical protein
MDLEVKQTDVEVKLKVMTFNKSIAKQLKNLYSLRKDDKVEVLGYVWIDDLDKLLVVVNGEPCLIRPANFYPEFDYIDGRLYYCDPKSGHREQVRKVFLV